MVLWLNSTPARPGEITAVELSGRVVRRSGFLPLPGGINQTRATPRGVFHGQGPWNNGVTQKGTFWGGGRSGHVVSHWLVTGYRETTLKIGLNKGFWCYTDGSRSVPRDQECCNIRVTRFWVTGRVTRAVLSGDLAAHQLSPHAPRENFLKARFVPRKFRQVLGLQDFGEV